MVFDLKRSLLVVEYMYLINLIDFKKDIRGFLL